MMIFISHSSADDQFVDWLRKELNRFGYMTWVDHVDMPMGKVWDEVVEEKLGNCQIMILVLSPNSVGSREVGIEWREFRNQSKTILPIKIRDCPLPLLLRHIQYLDFTNQEFRDKQFRKLLDCLPPPPRAVTKELLDTQEFRLMRLKEEVASLQRTLVGANQLLLAFLDLEKVAVFDLDKEKLFVGWYDRKSGVKPDIDLGKYNAFDYGVSRQHALFSRTLNGLTITDLGSMNGTFVEEKPLTPMQPMPLKNEAVIRMGSLVMQVFYRVGEGAH